MITVKDVINTSAFENAKVVAGKNGLRREINTVTVAEVPDAANWLLGGELVCTTAYFISQKVEYQVEWLESLSVNGAVALAIKTDRFLGEIPETIIKISNRLDFPIIEMPPKTTWPKIIESVMEIIMDNQVKQLKRAEEIHTKLTSLVLEDESIKRITDEISSLTGNPVIVEDARLNLLVIGGNDDLRGANEVFLQERLSQNFRNKIKKTAYYHDVLRNRTANSLEITLGENEGERVNSIITPILSNEMTYGFISLIETSAKMSDIDLIALKHGATALTLQLMKQIIHKQTTQSKYIALVDDLVNGRIHTDIVNEYLLSKHEWDKLMNVAVIDIKINENKETYTYTAWDRSEFRVTEIIKSHLSKCFSQVIIGNSGSVFTIIVSAKDHFSNTTEKLKVELISVLEECRQLHLINDYYGGIGNVQNELRKLDQSFNKAKTALTIAKSLPKKAEDYILIYEKLGIYRMISMVNNQEELKSFCSDFLADLEKYDLENNDVLMETLYVYLKCDCVIRETAKSLFIHPNTVTYRMKKIQSIIKHDLNSLEFKLTYLYAIEANNFLNNNHS